jgi:hypothetical protein
MDKENLVKWVNGFEGRGEKTEGKANEEMEALHQGRWQTGVPECVWHKITTHGGRRSIRPDHEG